MERLLVGSRHTSQCRIPSSGMIRQASICARRAESASMRGNLKGNRAWRGVFPLSCFQSSRVTVDRNAAERARASRQLQSALGLDELSTFLLTLATRRIEIAAEAS
jgi:hypothetical protein